MYGARNSHWRRPSPSPPMSLRAKQSQKGSSQTCVSVLEVTRSQHMSRSRGYKDARNCLSIGPSTQRHSRRELAWAGTCYFGSCAATASIGKHYWPNIAKNGRVVLVRSESRPMHSQPGNGNAVMPTACVANAQRVMLMPGRRGNATSARGGMQRRIFRTSIGNDNAAFTACV